MSDDIEYHYKGNSYTVKTVPLTSEIRKKILSEVDQNIHNKSDLILPIIFILMFLFTAVMSWETIIEGIQNNDYLVYILVVVITYFYLWLISITYKIYSTQKNGNIAQFEKTKNAEFARQHRLEIRDHHKFIVIDDLHTLVLFVPLDKNKTLMFRCSLEKDVYKSVQKKSVPSVWTWWKIGKFSSKYNLNFSFNMVGPPIMPSIRKELKKPKEEREFILTFENELFLDIPTQDPNREFATAIIDRDFNEIMQKDAEIAKKYTT